MDQVAELVVVIGRAVVGFRRLSGMAERLSESGSVVLPSPTGEGVGYGFDLFRRDVEDIVRRVEGEQFVTRLGNLAQFVVLELRRSRPLVSAVGQVAGAVVAVAAFDGGLGITRRYFGLPFPPSVKSLRVAICLFRRPKGSSS